MQSFLWYNLVAIKNQYQQEYNTTYQMKLPLEIEKTIEISEPAADAG